LYYTVIIDNIMLSWKAKAILVDAPIQSGKTAKTFQVLEEKLSHTSNTAILFITQSNSTSSANQLLQRSKSQLSANVVKPTNTFKSNNVPKDHIGNDNIMIVDYFHSRNILNIINFLKGTPVIKSVVLIIDEVDQGGKNGLESRFVFIRDIEKKIKNIRVIFITATVANLVKSIVTIGEENRKKFKESAIITDILQNECIEHQYAPPSDKYIGSKWFLETPDVFRELIFKKKNAEQSEQEYASYKQGIILEKINNIPEENKKLMLVSVSNKKHEHCDMADRMFECGFNITVELNSEKGKNYKVKYLDKNNKIKTWNIPYKEIDARTETGVFKELYYEDDYEDEYKDTGIENSLDYSLPHIIQAALFMTSDYRKQIKANIEESEYIKLSTLSNIMNTAFTTKLNKPRDLPRKPCVALIVGNLASRGITFQSPSIDFVCTSFCFTDTKNDSQRHAINSQKLGRSSGHLSREYTNNKPTLLSTKNMLMGAIANERIITEKAQSIENGKLFSLKTMITGEEWKDIIDEVIDEYTPNKTICNTQEDTTQEDTYVRLENVLVTYGNKGIVKNIINLFIEKKFIALTNNELETCNKKGSLVWVNYTRWDDNHNHMKIIEKNINGKYILRDIIRKHLGYI
jgi:hypothetical protein